MCQNVPAHLRGKEIRMSQIYAVVASEQSPSIFKQIRKRNGAEVPFEFRKITDAIHKAAKATGEFDQAEARRLTIRVLSLAQTVIEHEIPEVEEIQDLVEEVLLASPHKKNGQSVYPVSGAAYQPP